MKDKNIHIKLTEDGSHTLYNEKMNETYHSTHGAIQEANHVFILNGIRAVLNKDISILEVGFGTGLNAYLTYDFALKNNMNILYTGLETFPLSKEIINQLNYKSEIPNFDLEVFSEIHKSKWNIKNKIKSNFILNKVHVSLQDFTSNDKFDIIYYDAFGPRAQKEMWEKSLFEKLFKMLNIGGKLVTYCAMGQFKRDLKSCGFIVESVTGPPGKREMTIAYKKQLTL
ncbi:tRNA (5-methylaminomethyl-2-thiouridine)(34)-methyltransferase MnmD [Flavobacteriales bacterium]|nr:tRNA (5-methylaminomethyl-2-thiouridine)(34)-methyltransferase MnmD [Flavobacteriales bacterium]